MCHQYLSQLESPVYKVHVKMEVNVSRTLTRSSSVPVLWGLEVQIVRTVSIGLVWFL